jgi:hypothetical protein
MNKIGLILCATALIGSTATAQKTKKSTTQKSPLRFGLKAGANLSHMGVDNSSSVFNNEQASFQPGFYAGGLLEISGPAGSKFKGQVEALFNYHNVKNSYESIFNNNVYQYNQKTNFMQISVPVMLKYFVTPSFSINAGLSANFNIASKTKATNTLNSLETTTDNKEKDYLNTFHIGALVGATYYVYKGFFVDARYNYYFGTPLNYNSALLPKPKELSAIQIGVGYKFRYSTTRK